MEFLYSLEIPFKLEYWLWVILFKGLINVKVIKNYLIVLFLYLGER